MPRTPSLRVAEQWFSENARIINVLLETLGPVVCSARYRLCVACGSAISKAGVACKCRCVRYCSHPCAEADKAAHAPACGVRKRMVQVGAVAVSFFF